MLTFHNVVNLLSGYVVRFGQVYGRFKTYMHYGKAFVILIGLHKHRYLQSEHLNAGLWKECKCSLGALVRL